MVSKQQTATGYKLSLSRQGNPGPYGKDIESLSVDVNLQDPSKVHFKVKLCLLTLFSFSQN